MWQATKKGFTLIELMVVIAIIVILVAILYPSVMSAILTAHAAQVQTRISQLGNGCTLYRGDNNYYPGQSTSNMTELGRNAAVGTTTGSQLLAEALFLDFSDTNWDNNNHTTNLTVAATSTANRSQWHWRGNYAPLSWGVLSTTALPSGTTTSRCDLMTSAPSDTAVANRPYCIADQFTSNFLPILYFPADPTQTGLVQFQESDNWAYYRFTGSTVFAVPADGLNGATANKAPMNFGWITTDASGVTHSDFASFIADNRYGAANTPVHSGEFLLIGAGRDRLYGSTYTIRNWSN